MAKDTFLQVTNLIQVILLILILIVIIIIGVVTYNKINQIFTGGELKTLIDLLNNIFNRK